MPSFSTNLEEALHRALEYANEYGHEFITLEHLLFSLIDDQDAAALSCAPVWLTSTNCEARYNIILKPN